MKPLFFKIFYQGSLLKTRPFMDDQISIGSGEGLNLQLEGLSPWHVLIEKKADKYFIFDLGSEEGTYLNGEKVLGEIEITSGSKIKIGDYDLEFSIGPPQNNQDIKTSKPKKPVRKKRVSKKEESPGSFEQKEMDFPSISKMDDLSSKKDKKPKKTMQKPTQKVTQKADQKKKQKGYWKTFAPPSKISNLDEHLDPSIGNLIEVLVAWKERILSVHHFYKNDIVYLGSSEDCQISVPSLMGQKYKLLAISGGAKVFFNKGVNGALIKGKDRDTRLVTPVKDNQSITIKPYEMVRLDLKDALRIYVRTVKKTKKPFLVNLFNFTFSETVSLFLAILLTSLLIFYAGFYGPAFLLKDEDLLEKNIRVAQVSFAKIPVVDYKLGNKNQEPKVSKKMVKPKPKPSTPVPKKLSFKKPKKKPPTPKKISLPKKKKTPPKKLKVSVPKKGKIGKLSSAAPSKKKSRPKLKVGSARPGGSLKTGRKGSAPKTVAPDPSKVGLLGAFGGGGQLNQIDKGATGSGGLVGLAKDSTGYAGTQDSYAGEGIGTKTKQLSGGKGSSLIGISGGIKTKGRGGALKGTGTGGLGSRGRMSIEFSESDIDVDGEIDRAAILGVLRKNKVKFNNCYQYSLQQKTSIQGTLKMQWEILPNGKVRAVAPVSDNVGSKVLINCVAKTLRSLNFPAPPSGQIPRVAFPFVFSI